MALTTVQVAVVANAADGATLVGATVRALLTRVEQDGALLVDVVVAGTVAEDNICLLHLWPNSRGSNSSRYRVEIIKDGQVVRETFITVPEVPLEQQPLQITALQSVGPYPPISEVQAVLLAAQGENAKSRAWAVGDGEVEPGLHSAREYAASIGQAVSQVTSDMEEVGRLAAAVRYQFTYVTDRASEFGNLAGAMTQINTARDAAQQWAMKSDGPVIPGYYSAKSYAADAATQVGLATAKTAEAVVARIGAEAARDAALIQAGVYASEPIGRAAVADGVAFKVQGSGEVAAYEYRRVNAGTASTLIAIYPSASAIHTELANESVFEITDDHYRVVFRIGQDSKLEVISIVARSLTAGSILGATVGLSSGAYLEEAPLAEELCDLRGAAVRTVDATGLHKIVALQTKRLVVEETAFLNGLTVKAPIFRGITDSKVGIFTADINHIAFYGQSWASGFDAAPALTTVQRHDTISFNGGIRQQYSVAENPAALQSFVPAVEVTSTGTPEIPAATLGETGAVAMAHTIKDMIAAENNIPYAAQSFQLLVSAPGEGSKSIEALADNAQPYLKRLKEQISRAFAIAQSQGKTYVFSALTWLQGSGANPATYAAQLEALRADIDAYAKSVTGQAQDVKLITWQQYPNSNVSTAPGYAEWLYKRFVLAADTYPHIICAGPSYQFQQNSTSNIHFKNTGQIGLGQAFGQAFKRVVIDGVDFKPLRPLTLRRQGAIATLRLNVTAGRLVADTTQVVAASNLGFHLYDASNNPIAITSAVISGPDTVRITAGAAIPANAVLRYADVGTDSGDATKWRGNVRDNGADFTGVQRWLVAFSIPFSN